MRLYIDALDVVNDEGTSPAHGYFYQIGGRSANNHIRHQGCQQGHIAFLVQGNDNSIRAS